MDIHLGAVGDGNRARFGPRAATVLAVATGASIDELSPDLTVDGELDRDRLSLEEFRKPPVVGRFAVGLPSLAAAAGRCAGLRVAVRGPDLLVFGVLVSCCADEVTELPVSALPASADAIP
ncbi:hypothetical protein [Mycolicibacterium vinylchloridicum]|uniref:hypothetical protein n=1 Tax=Mycolicibacterium vinylchloridicum TaxID=2736928 RepID=UPI0015CBA3B3|nr:hypothetical protein [Mycolicibacterium vinylchloridicum]